VCACLERRACGLIRWGKKRTSRGGWRPAAHARTCACVRVRMFRERRRSNFWGLCVAGGRRQGPGSLLAVRASSGFGQPVGDFFGGQGWFMKGRIGVQGVVRARQRSCLAARVCGRVRECGRFSLSACVCVRVSQSVWGVCRCPCLRQLPFLACRNLHHVIATCWEGAALRAHHPGSPTSPPLPPSRTKPRGPPRNVASRPPTLSQQNA
jgi:hypothetical protein